MADQTKLEKYADIQAMVQKEIQTQFPALYEQYASRFGVASVPLHTHNGFDSPKVNAWDLRTSQAASGRVTMSTNGQRYKIGLNIAKGASSFAPSQIRFNGIAVWPSTTAPAIRALIQGDAFIGPSFYLQPLTSSEVTVGGPPQVVVQSSSYLLINNSGIPFTPATQALSSEGHIVSVQYNGGIVARATIPDLGDFGANEPPLQNGEILVDVELSSGWNIVGSFLIT